MRFRKLRIAWSVFWGLSAVLLIVLWVRSYWCNDAYNSPTHGNHFFICQSIRGKLLVGIEETLHLKLRQGWGILHEPLEKVNPPTLNKETGETNLDRIGASWIYSSNRFLVLLPHWVFAMIFASFAALWYWPEQFSLRTLLVATTLVAVVLGLAAYAATT
jgi:hypothetical protein